MFFHLLYHFTIQSYTKLSVTDTSVKLVILLNVVSADVRPKTFGQQLHLFLTNKGSFNQKDTILLYNKLTSISFSKKAGGRLALSMYVFLPTACFHFELLELVHVDLF